MMADQRADAIDRLEEAALAYQEVCGSGSTEEKIRANDLIVKCKYSIDFLRNRIEEMNDRK